MSTKKTTILVAEGQPQLLRLMALNLRLEGYEVLAASTDQETLEQIGQKAPTLVLLDVMMPKMNGLPLCQRIRALSPVPIIIVVARGQSQEKARCLDLGADDSLIKPFGVGELLACVSAVLRRAQFSDAENPQASRTVISTGDLTIDCARHRAVKAGNRIALTPTECGILAYLVQNAGRIVTQDALLGQIWGSGYLGESDLLQATVNRLRRKLEDDPAHPRYLLAKAGVGYSLALLPSPNELSFWAPWWSRS